MKQEQEGKVVVIAYFSQTLQASEKNWSVRDKELFAIVAGLKRSAKILGFNQKCVVYTDHKPLVTILSNPSIPNDKRFRWVEYILRFNVKIKYRPGDKNFLADVLSRQVAYPSEVTEAGGKPGADLEEITDAGMRVIPELDEEVAGAEGQVVAGKDLDKKLAEVNYLEGLRFLVD